MKNTFNMENYDKLPLSDVRIEEKENLVATGKNELVINREQKLELYYTKALLKLNPGLGEKTSMIVGDLMQCGLKPSEAYALITSVYSPRDLQGNGQATRAKYFGEAIIGRYGDELDKIRSNIATFRRFLAEVSEASNMRDTINGEGYTITFHDALLYQEIGLDAEKYLIFLQDLKSRNVSGLAIKMIIRQAALKVKKDSTLSLESLILNRERFGQEWEDDVTEEDLYREYDSMKKWQK